MTKQIPEIKSEEVISITSPVELAKKDFYEYIESIGNKIIDYTHFGSNYIIPLPANVNKPKREMGLFLKDNTYVYEFVYRKSRCYLKISMLGNAVPAKVSLQLLISNNRTEEPPNATMCLIFKMPNGKYSKPIHLDEKAKSKYSDFILAVNKANNRIQLALDDKKFILLMEYLSKQETETTLLFKNAGKVNYEDFDGRLYANAYLDKDGIRKADEYGIVRVKGQALKLSDKLKDTLPKLYLDDVDVKDVAYKLLVQIDKIFKGRLEKFLVIGAAIMVTYISTFWKKRAGFPIIYMYGATKQGKSLLQAVISNFYAYSNKNLSMGHSTDNAIAMKCHRANAIPILINDHDYFKSQGTGFENNIVQSYEGGIREKMRNGEEMNRLPVNTTAIYSSNYMPCDKPKIFNRLLPIYFPEGGIDTTEITDDFCNDLKRSRLLETFVKIPPETILEEVNNIEQWMLKNEFFKNKDRESNNVAIAYTGLLYLEKIAGYTISDKEAKLKDYCKWYNELFSSSNSPVERFLNALPTLVNKGKIKNAIHFYTEFSEAKILFSFDYANCINIYNQEVGYEGNCILDKRNFSNDLTTSKYFVAKGTKRFKNDKGQAYSYTLDITCHDVARYIGWTISQKEVVVKQ